MIELLAPGGNINKVKTAFHFGADAVYVGGKALSLRAFADNFDDKELEEVVLYAHSLNKKVYVTVNVFPKNEDFPLIEKTLKYLDLLKVDGIIISDPGIVYLFNQLKISVPLHLSTQANTLNKYSAMFWAKSNVKRIILARELTIDEIKEIRAFLPKEIELEMFVHGAMCISYSGRCLLSNYLTNRDSNNGECVQACRWEYSINEVSRKDNPLTIEEDSRGTYLLNSKDLKLINYIKDIIDAGVISLKIEGRMKSEYYVGTVVNAYRKAIDCAINNIPLPIEYELDLDKAGHRNYTTCYFLGKNNETQNTLTSKPDSTYEFIAEVESSDGENAVVTMRNRFRKGETIEVLSNNSETFNKTFEVTNMINSKGIEIDDAKLVQESVTINCPYLLTEHDLLRRKKIDG